MHTKITDADVKAIGSTAALARATAIQYGKGWSLPGYAKTPLGQRVGVTATAPTRTAGPSRDYDQMSLTQRIARATRIQGIPPAEREADRLAGRKSRVAATAPSASSSTSRSTAGLVAVHDPVRGHRWVPRAEAFGR